MHTGNYTVGRPLIVIVYRVFFTCSTGRWADTAATVQPYWQPEFPKENKTMRLSGRPTV